MHKSIPHRCCLSKIKAVTALSLVLIMPIRKITYLV
ncbi:hypothetical protein D043_2062C, partial [Vibrio parahaemolyticus EKP-021]